MISTASFSEDRQFRYDLTRIWMPKGRIVTFCMLNPSTADETKNDPTIERCQHRAMAMGFGGLVVVNIFPLRATDPKELKKHADPRGEKSPGGQKNFERVLQWAKESHLFIAGWGQHGKLWSQGPGTLSGLKNNNINIHALKMNKDGSPAHPLYISYDVKPFDINTKKVFNGV